MGKAIRADPVIDLRAFTLDAIPVERVGQREDDCPPRREGKGEAMPLRNLTTDEWTMAFTGLGTLATALGAGLVYTQISAASSALYGTNSYAVHKDLIDAYDHALEAKDQLQLKGSGDPALKAALKRQVIRLDTLVETAEGLRNNDGLSVDSWKHILHSMCPNFEAASYKIEEFDLLAAKTACENGHDLWRVPSK